jgi:hypothetical protein
MLRLAADEDFNGRIVRGVLRRSRSIDLVRIQDVGLSGAEDHEVLDYLANAGRLLVTHDAKTMPRQAYQRVVLGLAMPGVVVCSQDLPMRRVIEDIILLAECSDQDEWEGQVVYLPL